MILGQQRLPNTNNDVIGTTFRHFSKPVQNPTRAT